MKGERDLYPESQLVSEESLKRWRKRWRERVDFILEYPDRLNDWEATFAQDIEKRLSENKDLTLSQSSKLNQIFHKMEEAMG